ncbi:unnamed protein product, partial [Urochloa humidicola]
CVHVGERRVPVHSHDLGLPARTKGRMAMRRRETVTPRRPSKRTRWTRIWSRGRRAQSRAEEDVADSMCPGRRPHAQTLRCRGRAGPCDAAAGSPTPRPRRRGNSAQAGDGEE